MLELGSSSFSALFKTTPEISSPSKACITELRLLGTQHLARMKELRRIPLPAGLASRISGSLRKRYSIPRSVVLLQISYAVVNVDAAFPAACSLGSARPISLMIGIGNWQGMHLVHPEIRHDSSTNVDNALHRCDVPSTRPSRLGYAHHHNSQALIFKPSKGN
ncbi:hypothetical protein B0T10DRAFT_483107 [Thelonectria olida]|uniref:Uncharacterized protein n=1 Tax=Thelonectria olida TaxID=1576542 RepID=A0A9P8W7L4_9HYPO|nr:hypothetical protein B0T10DRAFT_483107 [Thelonectria olida]